MKNIICLVLCFVSLNAIAQQPDEKAVLSVLEKQRLAWNAGNIEEYMEGYWNSDSLMFIGKSGITYGWKNTLSNYKKNYADTVAMGKLNFNILQVKKLSGLYYSVVGKWHLSRSIGNLEGHFSLLFRKIAGNWKIISDHSS